MGRSVENPKYNVVSARVDDETLEKIRATKQTTNNFIIDAIDCKLRNIELNRKAYGK